MRRFGQPVEKEAQSENETNREPKAKISKSINKLTQIATLYNVTMVEAFKYLNYFQLAKISLASKKFCGLIRAHRNSLALLYANNISMKSVIFPAAITIFKRKLSPEAYNEWVIRNDYSKQAPFEDQVAGKESTQHDRKFYQLNADYRNSNLLDGKLLYGSTNVFFAGVEANHQYWPVFQHFIRLLTDPFIYIGQVEFTPIALNLFSTAMKPDCKRLQCEELTLQKETSGLDDSIVKSIHWIKNHFFCNTFTLVHDNSSNMDEELLDFLVTGSNWTSAFTISNYGFSQIIVDLVQAQNIIPDSHVKPVLVIAQTKRLQKIGT
ncbi:hypothetical protein Ddc_19595 [Ditylenchus destructor]|nr:hypothetical protein Ddc_19595 [Ditylenchus destructor]